MEFNDQVTTFTHVTKFRSQDGKHIKRLNYQELYKYRKILQNNAVQYDNKERSAKYLRGVGKIAK